MPQRYGVKMKTDQRPPAGDQARNGSAARKIVVGFGFSILLWGGVTWAVVQFAGM
jgi:hypothetical protein